MVKVKVAQVAITALAGEGARGARNREGARGETKEGRGRARAGQGSGRALREQGRAGQRQGRVKALAGETAGAWSVGLGVLLVCIDARVGRHGREGVASRGEVSSQ